MNVILNIFLISLVAGLATGLGGLIAVIRKPGKRSFGFLMGFAAGVMITLSFTELVNEALRLSGYITTTIGFGLGAIFMYLIDCTIPHIHFEKKEKGVLDGKLMKTGMMVAMGIVIHNIPEGICTSAPYYYFTKNKLKSFLISSSTAIPLIIGFIIAFILFKNIPPLIIGIVIAVTAGLMIYISADELIPMAHSQGRKMWSHITIFSLIIGVLFVIILGSI